LVEETPRASGIISRVDGCCDRWALMLDKADDIDVQAAAEIEEL
jgi:hypothetical protein